jgi:hypothetical protein
VGIASAYVLSARADATFNTGPTESALEKGHMVLAGGAFGLIVASVLGCLYARSLDNQFIAGVLAGLIAYIALGIAYVVTTPKEASASEAIVVVALLIIPSVGIVIAASGATYVVRQITGG